MSLSEAELMHLASLNTEPQTLGEITAHAWARNRSREIERERRRRDEAARYATYLDNLNKPPAAKPRAPETDWAKIIGTFVAERERELIKRIDAIEGRTTGKSDAPASAPAVEFDDTQLAAREAIRAMRRAVPGETPDEARARSCKAIAMQQELNSVSRKVVTSATQHFVTKGSADSAPAPVHPDVARRLDEMETVVRAMCEASARNGG